jgi:hypothetical protein
MVLHWYGCSPILHRLARNFLLDLLDDALLLVLGVVGVSDSLARSLVNIVDILALTRLCLSDRVVLLVTLSAGKRSVSCRTGSVGLEMRVVIVVGPLAQSVSCGKLLVRCAKLHHQHQVEHHACGHSQHP